MSVGPFFRAIGRKLYSMTEQDPRDALRALESEALAAIDRAQDSEALEAARIDYLGRKEGRISVILRGLGGMSAEDRPAVGQEANRVKGFILAPYALFANIVGESAIGQAGSADVDVDFSDILEVLKIGAMGHVEARIGRWGLITDFAHMKLADDINTPRGRVVDAEVEQLELETYLFYRFPMERGWVDAYALDDGRRLWGIVDVDFGNVGEFIQRNLAYRLEKKRLGKRAAR